MRSFDQPRTHVKNAVREHLVERALACRLQSAVRLEREARIFGVLERMRRPALARVRVIGIDRNRRDEDVPPRIEARHRAHVTQFEGARLVNDIERSSLQCIDAFVAIADHVLELRKQSRHRSTAMEGRDVVSATQTFDHGTAHERRSAHHERSHDPIGRS